MREKLAVALVKMKTYKITQKELSKKTGFSEQWISMIFNGKKVSYSAETKICEAIETIIKNRTA